MRKRRNLGIVYSSERRKKRKTQPTYETNHNTKVTLTRILVTDDVGANNLLFYSRALINKSPS
jgi:hypothetical protein